jgi:glycosyltransferase involved in cell wall biosynthesis
MDKRTTLKIALLGVGSSPHIQRLAKSLAALGHEMTVISAAKYGPFPEIANVSFRTFESGVSPIKKLAQIKAILEATKPDVLHSHFVNYGGVLGTATGYHPHLISAWGCDVLNVPRESLLKKIAVTGALRAADGLLPVSTQLRDEITRLTGGHPFNVVSHWGVSTDHFSISEAGARFRERYGISKDERVALSPRLVEPLYMQHQLFEAWPAVKAHVPKARLMVLRSIVTDENYLRTLEKRAADLGFSDEIIWIEKVSFEDMPGMYLAADAVVSIARSDGTPMTVLEAMSCGRPMVVSDLPSLKEWVENDVNGLRVNQNSVPAVADAVASMLAIDGGARDAMSRANRAKIREVGDHRKCIGEIEKIYLEFARKDTNGGDKNWAKTLGNLVGWRG